MTETDSSNLYDRIGETFIRQALTIFYERAFTDGIIGHFFFGKDRQHITDQQIDFATAMLGGPRRYRGKPLAVAHAKLAIRPPHFRRRQVLLAEVLTELELAEDLKKAWLALEENLLQAVIKN